jgi:tetratricopeptide (TPR) repeat protein
MTCMSRAACLIVILLLAVALAAAQDTRAGARAVYNRAVELEAEGNGAAALALLWEAAGLAPRDAEIQNRLGEALERIGALEAAIDAFGSALAARPDHRRASNNLILTLVKAGRGSEAVERARALVSAAPRDPDRHFTLGLALSDVDIEAAIDSFRRTLDLAPSHTLARYNLAMVLRRADRLDEAVRELHRAIDMEPRAEAYYTLGGIHFHTGDLVRARRALARAVAISPDYADAHHTLGVVHQAEGDWAGAARSLRRAIELRPGLWGAHNTLGLVLQRLGDDDGAARHLAEADRLRRQGQLEQEATVWTAVGIARLDAGELIEAVDAFRRATTILDTWAPAHYQMGRAFHLLGEADAARSAFERARQLNPSLVPLTSSGP